MITAKDLSGASPSCRRRPKRSGTSGRDEHVDLDETARLAEAWCATAPTASWRSAPWANAPRQPRRLRSLRRLPA